MDKNTTDKSLVRENSKERKVIPVDSVKVYDNTAIIQMPSDAWEEISSQLKNTLNLNMKVPVYTQIRDRLFRSLFHEKEELLSLYNAVSGKDYTNPEDLKIVTLEGAIYLGMKNDLSFIISNGLFLYEHQSTDNRNIPLRDLFYIAEQFRVLTVKEDIYSSRQISLPTPHFVVLYNGETKKPDRFEYRLSDAYTQKEESYDLELKVTVVNVNKGHNPDIMARCKTLDEFAEFTEVLRDFNKTMEISQAISATIDHCIDHDILRDYLLRNKAEVSNMVLYDFDVERYKADRAKEVEDLANEVKGLELKNQELESENQEFVSKVSKLTSKSQELESENQRLRERLAELERKMG